MIYLSQTDAVTQDNSQMRFLQFKSVTRSQQHRNMTSNGGYGKELWSSIYPFGRLLKYTTIDANPLVQPMTQYAVVGQRATADIQCSIPSLTKVPRIFECLCKGPAAHVQYSTFLMTGGGVGMSVAGTLRLSRTWGKWLGGRWADTPANGNIYICFGVHFSCRHCRI